MSLSSPANRWTWIHQSSPVWQSLRWSERRNGRNQRRLRDIIILLGHQIIQDHHWPTCHTVFISYWSVCRTDFISTSWNNTWRRPNIEFLTYCEKKVNHSITFWLRYLSTNFSVSVGRKEKLKPWESIHSSAQLTGNSCHHGYWQTDAASAVSLSVQIDAFFVWWVLNGCKTNQINLGTQWCFCFLFWRLYRSSDQL